MPTVPTAHALLLIAVTALITALLRFLPFFLFGGKRETPAVVRYLGRVLPYAIMGMLVVYCLKGISFSRAPFGLAEGIASAVVILLHVWKRSTLLSIVSGTLCYMFLLQVVFA